MLDTMKQIKNLLEKRKLSTIARTGLKKGKSKLSTIASTDRKKLSTTASIDRKRGPQQLPSETIEARIMICLDVLRIFEHLREMVCHTPAHPAVDSGLKAV